MIWKQPPIAVLRPYRLLTPMEMQPICTDSDSEVRVTDQDTMFPANLVQVQAAELMATQ